MDYCNCGSLILNGKCTNKGCPESNNKRKGWVIEGMALDFKKPVTFEQAIEAAKKLKKIRQEFENELNASECRVQNLLR